MRRISDVLDKANAQVTFSDYAKQFRKFESWCQENGELALPVDPDAIADCLIEKTEETGWRKASIRDAWAAVADRHWPSGFEETANHTGTGQTVRGLGKGNKRPQVLAQSQGSVRIPRITGGCRAQAEEDPRGKPGSGRSWTSSSAAPAQTTCSVGASWRNRQT